MAQQEEGWPLGLQPLNARVGLARNHDYSGSISFNTIVTGFPTSSTDSSSDLATEVILGLFFHDKSITLGSVIGVSSILELSKISVRERKAEATREKRSNINRSKVWLFSLCSRDDTDADQNVNADNAPSLGHFLAEERRAASDYRRSLSPTVHGPVELALTQPNMESISCHGADAENRKNARLDNDDHSYGVPVLLSCMCGQPSL
ncbi:uncharacterized protein LOC111302157 [Durio zibethinus]|uniref:Uncharacterized protein LOC111302157 n=1 Tax=Durio zibethinus TaxID=66656 RepID=A0A6P5ZMR7_DURZI|nr:uncharacterized protein LOC111302157 [Durio zibethinus]